MTEVTPMRTLFAAAFAVLVALVFAPPANAGYRQQSYAETCRPAAPPVAHRRKYTPRANYQPRPRAERPRQSTCGVSPCNPRPTQCNKCGDGPSASLPGVMGMCSNGQQTNRPKPINGVWEPKVNPRSGQCTWWNADGLVPIYR